MGIAIAGLLPLFSLYTPEKPIVLDADGFVFQTGTSLSRKQHKIIFHEMKSIEISNIQNQKNTQTTELRFEYKTGEILYVQANNLLNSSLPEITLFALASGVVVNDLR